MAGLHQTGGALEFVDAAGTPLFHVAPPFVVDHNGRTAPAPLSVVGCAVDYSDQPSWGRRPIAPGAESCRLVVAWDQSGIDYPAVLDPSWTAGAAMPFAMVAVPCVIQWNGRQVVVAAGGITFDSAPAPSTPIYDPDTDTWSLGPGADDQNIAPMVVAFSSTSGGPVDSIFITGSYDGNYNLSTSTQVLTADATGALSWTHGAPSKVVHIGAVVAPIGNKILIAGGQSSFSSPTETTSCELFDTVTRTFVDPPPPDLLEPHEDAGSAVLADGHSVLVAGGYPQDTDPNPDMPIARAELFTGDQWIQLPDMPVGKAGQGMLLPDGRVLFAGGVESPLINSPNGRYSKTAELFTYSATAPYGSWAQTTVDTVGRWGSTTLLPNGTVLFAPTSVVTTPADGSQQLDTPTSDVFLFDPRANAWAPTAPTMVPHDEGGLATVLKSTGEPETILFGGVSSWDGTTATPTTTTEIYQDGGARIINIDARALAQPGLLIPGLTDIFDTTKVQQVAAAPGGYYLQIYSGLISDVSFTVGADGSVDYDPSLDGVLSGRGSNTLVINGRHIYIETDLSQTAIDFLLFGYPQFQTRNYSDVVLLPAHGYSFLLGSSTLSNFSFDVDLAGHLHIPPMYMGFARGEGTSVLELLGETITITAAPATPPLVIFNLIGDVLPLSNLRTNTMHLLPVNPGAGYLIELDDGEIFAFNLDLDGHLLIDPSMDPYLAGAGTPALYVRHHAQ